MPAFALLVTPDGKWVLHDSDEFLALLGDPEPDYDATAFAVRNLGFVKLRIFPQLMEIELHPRNVGFCAVQAVQEQLRRCSRVKLFVIKYFEQQWRSETSSSVERAIGRLGALRRREAYLIPS